MGSHDKQRESLGARVFVAPAKSRVLWVKSAVCLTIMALFFYSWRDFGLFSGALPWYRAAVPLLLPVTGLLFGLLFACHTQKRVVLYEKGLVYHTLFFELDCRYTEIRDVSRSIDVGDRFGQAHQGLGLTKRAVPLTVLSVRLADGRTWTFRSNIYDRLPELEQALKEQIAKQAAG